MIKKIMILGAVVALISGATYGSVAVSWSTTGRIYRSADMGGGYIPVDATVAFFWSQDATVGFNASDPYNPTDDIFLGAEDISTLATSNGRISLIGGNVRTYVESSYSLADDYFVGGRVYAAIFDINFNGSTPPPVGTWYRVGIASASNLQDSTPLTGSPPQPDGYDVTGGSNPWTLNAQVVAVPEPSTVGLLLVGIGLVAARRFRRG